MSLSKNICDLRSAPEEKKESLDGIVFVQFADGSCSAVSDTLVQILEAFPAASLIVGVPRAYFELTELHLDQPGKKLKIFPHDSPLLATLQAISKKYEVRKLLVNY